VRRRARGEGSITRRSDGRFQVRIDLGRDPLGKRQRKYEYADTEAGAAKVLRRLQRQKEQGRLTASGVAAPRTLDEWLDQWLETVKASREPLTYQRYESLVRLHIKPVLGRRRLSQLDPLEIQRFLDAMQRSFSVNMVRSIWIALSSALGRANRLGLIHRNPASSELIEMPAAEAAPENILTLAEARAFLAGIRGDRLYALYLTAAVLGQRKSSLLGLRRQDIAEDFTRIRWPMKLVRIDTSWQLRSVRRSRSKKAPRSLPLPAPVAAALREHLARQQAEREAAGPSWSVMESDGRPIELVFTRPNGLPLHGQYVTAHFQRLLKRAGLGERRFHDLRHSAASVMLALKIPLKTVSEVLAHSGIQITADLYGHLEDDGLREQLAVLDAAWGEDEAATGRGEESAG